MSPLWPASSPSLGNVAGTSRAAHQAGEGAGAQALDWFSARTDEARPLHLPRAGGVDASELQARFLARLCVPAER